ncbi:MAG TPA: BON domain-containing protein [Candidatus Synoicihabitans sp.]|nr:BON domain-containing protein [Candidatus Synoicihabitans sp.]
MKGFLIFVLGVLVGAGAFFLYHERTCANPARPASTVADLSERAKADAREVGDRIAGKLRDWNLTSDDIKREFAEGGRVIRSKAKTAGARIDDARIVAVIKSKYVLDEHLKALDINIDCRDGKVRLAGQASSPEAIGRAIGLALETDGVVEVDSQLTPVPER